MCNEPKPKKGKLPNIKLPKVKLPQVVGKGGEVDDSNMTPEENAIAALKIIEPGGSGLLTKIKADEIGKKCGFRPYDCFLYPYLEAQRDLTASIVADQMVDKIEEVKKILDTMAEKGDWIDRDKYIVQICQLFEPKPDEGGLLTDEELVEECMPTLERFEVVEKQVFFPIPKPPEFSSTIRIYASTMSREAVRKTLDKTASIKDAEFYGEGECGFCGGKMVRNPHPDAGKPSKLLEVGAVYVCIPCERKACHNWAERAMKAEAECQERIINSLGLLLTLHPLRGGPLRRALVKYVQALKKREGVK